MLVKTCLVAALLCLAAATEIENIRHPRRIPGEYLITLKPVSAAQKANYVLSAAGKIVGRTNAAILNMFCSLESPILHVKAEDAVISNAFEIPEVTHIEADVLENKVKGDDFERKVKADVYDKKIKADVVEKKIEQCSSQNTGSAYWGLSRINSRSAPNYSGATYSHRSSGGSGVRVYVLNSGIRTTHQEFSGGRAIFGTNTIGGGNSDIDGHGTLTAGTVLGSNSGVAKGATAIAVKVLYDNGFGTTSSLISGINWVIADMQDQGRAVISMCVGGYASTTLDNAVASAVSANIPTVVQAGNNNGDACNGSPARSPAAITVGSTDNSDTLSIFSDWGTCVDILAPGSNIRSASNSGDSSYINYSDTSMACSHVSGAAAVYLQQNPSASASAVKSALTSGESNNYINLRGTSGTPNIMLYENC